MALLNQDNQDVCHKETIYKHVEKVLGKHKDQYSIPGLVKAAVAHVPRIYRQGGGTISVTQRERMVKGGPP